MGEARWDHRSPSAMDRDVDAVLTEWLQREVVPFSAYWAERLEGISLDGRAGLGAIDVTTEAHLAGQGGPGNPALLVLPTEDGFKRHARGGDLLAAAREARGGSEARRAALYRRFKPVHVHEAGHSVLMTVAYTRTDLDRLHLAGARLFEVLDLSSDDSLVSAVPAGPSIDFWGLYHAALATRMTALHPRSEGVAALTAVRRALAVLPATALAVPRAEAADLLAGLTAREVPADQLRTLLVVGPPPPAEERIALHTAASALAGRDVRVLAVWGPQMGRVLYGESRPPDGDPPEATYGLVTYPDLEHLEVRDVARGAPAGTGEPGELVITSVGWRGTALVRAATGDWVGGLVRGVPCPASGRTVPRLAPRVSTAAWQPWLRNRDGELVRVDLRSAEAALAEAGLGRSPVRDWSLRVTDERLVLALDVDEDATDLARTLGTAVGGAVGVAPEVRLSAADARRRPQVGAAGPT